MASGSTIVRRVVVGLLTLGAAVVVLWFLLILTMTGAFQRSLPGPSHDVRELGFIGIVESVQTDDWEVFFADGTPAGAGAGGAGGPTSSFLVGPGSLLLTNGDEIEIAANTPGGTFCPLLPGGNTGGSQRSECLILGELQPDTNTASWFAAEMTPVDVNGSYFLGRIVDVKDGKAYVDHSGVSFALEVPTTVRFDDCGPGATLDELPDASRYSAWTDATGILVSIVCHDQP